MSDDKIAEDGTGLAGGQLDLVVVALLTLGTAVSALLPTVPRPILLVLGVPFLVFFPGYVLVSALFPETAGDGTRTARAGLKEWGTEPSDAEASPNWLARVALSLVVSPVVVALLGVALSPFAAISLVPVVVGLTTIVLVGAGLAVWRRQRLLVRKRARPLQSLTVARWRGAGSQTLVLAAALLLLVGTITLAVAVPPEGDAYTEAYLLTEDDTEEYQTNYTAGERATVRFAIENHENQATSYDVVTVLQEVDENGSVTGQETLDSYEAELEDETRITVSRAITPTLTGDELRLQILVYEGTPPDVPDPESADYTVYRWVTVDE